MFKNGNSGTKFLLKQYLFNALWMEADVCLALIKNNFYPITWCGSKFLSALANPYFLSHIRT